MRSRPHESGFAHIGITVLFIVVIAVIGVAAYNGIKQLASTESSGESSSSVTKTPDVYTGWNTFTFKERVKFNYPPNFFVSPADSENRVTITSYAPESGDTPAQLHCAAVGQTVPDCDVKIELTLDGNTVDSNIFPQTTELRATANRIINSVKVVGE